MISKCQLKVLISYKILNVYATKSHLQLNQLKIVIASISKDWGTKSLIKQNLLL
jgi:hypothetical protein